MSNLTTVGKVTGRILEGVVKYLTVIALILIIPVGFYIILAFRVFFKFDFVDTVVGMIDDTWGSIYEENGHMELREIVWLITMVLGFCSLFIYIIAYSHFGGA